MKLKKNHKKIKTFILNEGIRKKKIKKWSKSFYYIIKI